MPAIHSPTESDLSADPSRDFGNTILTKKGRSVGRCGL